MQVLPMLSVIVDGVGRFLSSHCFWQPRLKPTRDRCRLKYCTLVCHAHIIGIHCICACRVCVITSYLASSPLRRPMLWAVSVIWGSRLEGSPICGFCSYTPFIFSSASLRSRDRKVLFVLRMWALIKEVSLLCSSADKNRKDGQKILQSSFSTLYWENVFVFVQRRLGTFKRGEDFLSSVDTKWGEHFCQKYNITVRRSFEISLNSK